MSRQVVGRKPHLQEIQSEARVTLSLYSILVSECTVSKIYHPEPQRCEVEWPVPFHRNLSCKSFVWYPSTAGPTGTERVETE